jgi:hypothetical protein
MTGKEKEYSYNVILLPFSKPKVRTRVSMSNVLRIERTGRTGRIGRIRRIGRE